MEAEINFIIRPVRGVTEQENKSIEGCIASAEKSGIKIYDPFLHTNQNDDTGYNICMQNCAAISRSKKVLLFYNPESLGSVFDIGMTYFAEKPIEIINNGNLKEKTSDLFELFLHEYARNSYSRTIFHNDVAIRKARMPQYDVIEYVWEPCKKDLLFDFGMAFMSAKPIILKNREKVEEEAKKQNKKSFEKIILHLDSMWRK